MALVYLDQNVLIKLGFKALADPGLQAKINAAIQSGSLTVVVSMWHLVETANTTKIDNAVKLADFIDSLHPAWLLERYDVRSLEVHEDFFRFAGIHCPYKARVTSR